MPLVLSFTCLIRWPLMGFMVGSVTGDPTAWHKDPQVVRLCTTLTWLLVLPCLLRVLVQGPIWLAASSGTMDAGTAVAALGILKILRDGQVYVPDVEQPVEAGDELLFVVPADVEDQLERLLAPVSHGG